MSLADFPKSEYAGGTAIVPEETDMQIQIYHFFNNNKYKDTLHCIHLSKCIIKAILWHFTSWRTHRGQIFKKQWFVSVAEISRLLVPSMGRTPKMLDPTFPIMQLHSVFKSLLGKHLHLSDSSNL